MDKKEIKKILKSKKTSLKLENIDEDKKETK